MNANTFVSVFESGVYLLYFQAVFLVWMILSRLLHQSISMILALFIVSEGSDLLGGYEKVERFYRLLGLFGFLIAAICLIIAFWRICVHLNPPVERPGPQWVQSKYWTFRIGGETYYIW